MKRVEVEWLDSVGNGRWRPAEDAIREAARDEMLHRSVGFLLKDDEESVLLAQSRGEDGVMVADTLQIPRVAVLNVHELRR